MRDGALIPSALILSHDKEYERLAQLTPQALSVAVVAGDPCLDRMRASLAHRTRYRAMLGAGPDTTVVVVSSTWGTNSLLGSKPDLIGATLAELPSESHIVAAILHPNIWFAHGPWQIRQWLSDYLRAGLRLVPPEAGWQQALIAADVVVGDNGAVTGYAAAISRPTLLAVFPHADVAPDSAVAALGECAQYIDYRLPLHPQLHNAIREHDPGRLRPVAELASSRPGAAAQLLQTLCYDFISLPEPVGSAPVHSYDPRELNVAQRFPAALRMSGWIHAGAVHLTGLPADVVAHHAAAELADPFLVAVSDHPRHDLLARAELISHHGPLDGPDPAQSVAAAFASYPLCQAILVEDHLLCLRDAETYIITATLGLGPIVVAAAAVYLLHRQTQPVPEELTIRYGPARTAITIQRR